MHKKAWDQVAEYVQSNLEFFQGRALEAESTILPNVTTWVHDTLGQIAESKMVIKTQNIFILSKANAY